MRRLYLMQHFNLFCIAVAGIMFVDAIALVSTLNFRVTSTIMALLVSIALFAIYPNNRFVHYCRAYHNCILLYILVLGIYFVAAMVIHGYSVATTLLYLHGYYALPVILLGTIKYNMATNIKHIVILYVSVIVLFHIYNGIIGNYYSHHMVGDVSGFPGIHGHFHNSYIAICASILAFRLLYHKYRSKFIRIIGYTMALALFGFPVFGAARGAILTNIWCIVLYVYSLRRKLTKLTYASVSKFLAVGLFFFAIFIFSSSISDAIARYSTSYDSIEGVLDVGSYHKAETATYRYNWWSYAVRTEIARSPLFGTVFANIDSARYAYGQLAGSIMHSYYIGALLDGGIILLLGIVYILLYPLAYCVLHRIPCVIEETLWLFVILGNVASSTWMYGMRRGSVLSIIISYCLFYILKRAKTKQ